MEKDESSIPNRNGRVYDVNTIINAIKEWTQIDLSIKDVNTFYSDKKIAKNTDRLEQFIMDPQSVFIDYINLLHP